MSYYTSARELSKSQLTEGRYYSVFIKDEEGLDIDVRFRFGLFEISQEKDCAILRNREKLDILKKLDQYPSVFRLANIDKCKSDFLVLEKSLDGYFDSSKKIYIYGAHKIGAKIARASIEHGLTVSGFIDNNPAKKSPIPNIPIYNSNDVVIEDEVVVVASGHYSNEIFWQIADRHWPKVLNFHQFSFAIHLLSCGEDFRSYSSALYRDGNRLISAFLELDDEQSRRVFDGLIGMRASLDTKIAEKFKSPFEDEYLDSLFIFPKDIAYYVDAGAAAGDTLDRLEKRFGPVDHAYMFEPELPVYYEGLKKYSSRNNVFFYNFGLSSNYDKAVYQPVLSFDVLGEVNNSIPNDITSFIQAIKLDDIVTEKVTLFKLDIEGGEASALLGAAKTIKKFHPKLCVCTYHRSDDLWKLLDIVKKIDNSYKVGLRHYADIIEDSSFYFY